MPSTGVCWRAAPVALLLLIGLPCPRAAAQGDPPAPLARVQFKVDRPVALFEEPRDGDERLLLPAQPAAWSGPGPGLAAERTLSTSSSFRIGGPGITGADFELPENALNVRVDITTGRRARYIAGTIGWITGSATALAGISLLFLGWANTGPQSSAVGPPGWLPASKQLYIAGGLLLPAGLVGVLVGCFYTITGRTRVVFSPLATVALRKDGALRLSAQGLLF